MVAPAVEGARLTLFYPLTAGATHGPQMAKARALLAGMFTNSEPDGNPKWSSVRCTCWFRRGAAG